MPHHVALLRGINVGGRTVKMDRLRAVLTTRGFDNVETLIASGNVLFRAPGRSDAALERTIEATLEQAFGFTVTTMVRSAAEMQKIAAREPFGATGEARIHIAFLKTPPPVEGVKKVVALCGDSEGICLEGRELYFQIEGRMMDSAMFRAPIEKLLGVPMTVRNANTVRKLADKVST